MRALSITIYLRARELAEAKGIIIADSKFTFGLADRRLILIGELLTPDTSRFWPVENCQPGKAPKALAGKWA